MNVTVPYGRDGIELMIHDEHFGGILQLERSDSPDVSSVLDHRLIKADMTGFIDGCSRLLLVVNDAYRSTPTHIALDHIRVAIESIPEIRLIVATGLHRKPTHDEMTAILGDFDLPQSAQFHSDAYDDSQFFVIGKYGTGEEIRLHKLLDWADRIIVIGSVEPHYFAGYTGGPKSFMPGLAHNSTIRANHGLAVSMECRPCRLDGNPVAESIREAVEKLDKAVILSIQFVVDPHGDVIDVFAGDLWRTFDDAVKVARSVYLRPVSETYQVVVAISSPPLDRNLYQLQKSFENTRAITEDGGTIIAVSQCREGIGNDEFFKLAERYPSEDDILAMTPVDLGIHKLYRTALHKKSVSICLKSDLDDDVVRKVYLEPVGDLQKAIDAEIEKRNKKCKVIFVKNAGHLVPYVDRAA
jgi:nickel-dependent lactate racemase